MNVKDKVYKVVVDNMSGRLVVEEYQILRIMRRGRLICFRTNGQDISRGQWSFYPKEIGSTPDEAKKIFEQQLRVRLEYVNKEMDNIKNLKAQMEMWI